MTHTAETLAKLKIADLKALLPTGTKGSKDELIQQVLASQKKRRTKKVVAEPPAESVKVSKSGKVTKIKDPNAPKRGTSAFMFYSKEVRPDLQAKNPNDKLTEISTKIGAAWRGLSDSQKRPYEELAAVDKARYEEEKANYTPPAGSKSAKAEGPKRAMTAFIFFSNDQRNKVKAANPDMKLPAISSKLGEMWRGMSEAAKKKYQDMADADKIRYEEEKAAAS